MTRRTQQAMLAALVLGAGLIAVNLMGRDDGPVAARAVPRTRTPQATAPEGAMPVADVRLELLESARRELPEPQRNPFRFQARPAPPAPKPPVAPAPVVTAPPRAPAPSGPPPPPPIALRFIGLVDAPTQVGRVAIVSDGRGNVFYGKEGDIIEGRYRVVKVSPDIVELSYLDGRGRQTIRLSGQ